MSDADRDSLKGFQWKAEVQELHMLHFGATFASFSSVMCIQSGSLDVLRSIHKFLSDKELFLFVKVCLTCYDLILSVILCFNKICMFYSPITDNLCKAYMVFINCSTSTCLSSLEFQI